MKRSRASIPVVGNLSATRFVVMGSQPYSVEEIGDLLSHCGAEAVDLRPMTDFTHVVIGSEDFDEQTVSQLRTAIDPDEAFSQEELLAAALFGRYPDPDRNARMQAHTGLRCLFSEANPQRLRNCRTFSERVDQRWSDLKSLADQVDGKQPNTIRTMIEGFRKSLADLVQARHELEAVGCYPFRTSVQSLVQLQVFARQLAANVESVAVTATTMYDGWERESELKHRYGYSVKVGISPFHRHNALRKAVEDGFDPERIVNHLNAFISLYEDYPPRQEAVARWVEDRKWFQQNLL